MLAIWSPLVPLPFLNTAWTSRSSWFTYCWSLAWRILSISFPAYEMSAMNILCIAFLWDWNENRPFPVLRSLLSFPDLLAYWLSQHHSTFTASSFRIWNSSTEIPSPALALFIVMLPKDHLIGKDRETTFSPTNSSKDHLNAEQLPRNNF